MAIPFTDHLTPELVVYDCMDELAAFKFAPVALKENEKTLLNKADVVFTGGYSIYESKKNSHHNIYPFPSSIDKEHFGSARITRKDPDDQARIPHPRFGFFGVIDERLDIDLIADAARLRPDWQFVIIGPVVKIDPATLPRLSGKLSDMLIQIASTSSAFIKKIKSSGLLAMMVRNGQDALTCIAILGLDNIVM